MAKDLNCFDKDDGKMMECLKKVSWDKTISSGIFKWYHDVESSGDQGAFLVEDPNVSFEKGMFMKIPLMAGIVRREYDYIAYGK